MNGRISLGKRKLKVMKKDQRSYESEKTEISKIEFDEDLSGDQVDIVFCIDTTGSMGTYITLTKNILCSMVEHFKSIAKQPLFGIVAYRDHPPQENTYVTKVYQLSSADVAVQYLKELDAAGGGDLPEAVLQGLWDSLVQIKWRSPDETAKISEENQEPAKLVYKKVIIHVGDAPAHGKEFHEDNINDAFSNGCPSNISLKSLSDKMNELNVNYYFCRLNTSTDKMAALFKENFKNFEPLDLIDDNSKQEEGEYEFIDEEDYEKMKDKYEVCEDRAGKAFEKKVAGAIFKEMGVKKI